MSFINLARTGFETMSQYGKLIGTGKNSGIKVYEKLGCDGKRILTSIDKEGKPLKEIITDRGRDYFRTNTQNFKTNKSTKSFHEIDLKDGEYLYRYKKTSSSGDVDKFELAKSSDDLKGDTLRNLRKIKKEAFQNKGNTDYVSVEQINNENSYYQFQALPKKNQYILNSGGDYKINDEIVFSNGESVYFLDGKDGLVHSPQSNNHVHEANIAKSFIEGLQKIWTK